MLPSSPSTPLCPQPHVRPSARRSPLLRPSSGASLRPLLLRPSSHAPLRPLLAARRSSAPSDLADRGRRRWPAIEDGGTVGRGGGTRQHGGSAVLVAAPSAELVAVKLFASSSLAGSGSAHAISEDVWAQRWPEIEGGMVGRGGGCSSKLDSSGATPSSRARRRHVDCWGKMRRSKGRRGDPIACPCTRGCGALHRAGLAE